MTVGDRVYWGVFSLGLGTAKVYSGTILKSEFDAGRYWYRVESNHFEDSCLVRKDNVCPTEDVAKALLRDTIRQYKAKVQASCDKMLESLS